MTVAPVRRASCTTSEPTPPAAPETTTVSPSPRSTERTAAQAVVPATNRPPATSHGTPSGRRARSPASTTTSSAWLARLWVKPITWSPTAKPSTSGPSSSITPARSLPCPEGNVEGQRSANTPLRMDASPGLMPAAFTRTRTSPGPGTGRSTSTTLQHVDPAVLLVPDRLWHGLSSVAVLGDNSGDGTDLPRHVTERCTARCQPRATAAAGSTGIA